MTSRTRPRWPTCHAGRYRAQAAAARLHLARPGIVAGAVLRAARTSARATEAALAAAAGVSEAEIRGWEAGTLPFSAVPAPVVERVEASMVRLGAEPSLVADLAAAAWCDLIICAIAHGDDPSCLLADPLAQEDRFLDLLNWVRADIGHSLPVRHGDRETALGARSDGRQGGPAEGEDIPAARARMAPRSRRRHSMNAVVARPNTSARRYRAR